MTLSVGIMGAGRMAQGFDAPGSKEVLSLAHAAQCTAGMVLGGFYDRDPARAQIAEQRWDVSESPRQRDVWLDRGWDVICIATPDDQHGCDLADALARRPSAIVVEKPLSTDSDEAVGLLEQAAALGVPVLVDFPRRYHSGVEALASLIERGELGNPLSASFAHSGSAAHAGVHMFDLFHQWWDRDWQVDHAGCSGDTHLLALRDGDTNLPLTVARLPDDPYYLWDMSILCQGGCITLTHSPEVLELSVPAPHPLYSDFQVLTPHLSFEMEGEPLLQRLMETVLEVAHDAGRARAHAVLEQRRQQFSGKILRCLEDSPAAASRRMAS
jgi:hypothetical protein